MADLILNHHPESEKTFGVVRLRAISKSRIHSRLNMHFRPGNTSCKFFYSALDGLAQQQASLAPAILASAANMADADVFQSNEKRIYQLCFENDLWQSEVVPATAVTDQISQIADQCAIAGGTGVYLARMLANRYGLGQDWDDRLLCTVQERNEIITDAPVNWKVIPNPASEIVKISCSQPVTSDASITLFDIYGIIRYRGTIPHGQSILSIPVGTLSSGIYFYEISTGDKVDGSKGKLIIQH